MKLITTILMLFVGLTSFSQQEVTGHISNKTSPLIGANISIKHSERGIISDINGDFKISVTPKDTLVLSYLGYDTKEIVVGNQKFLNVFLDGDITLDEVTVIAYGSHFCRMISCGISVKHLNEKQFKSNVITEKLYPNPSKTGRFQLKLMDDYKNVNIEAFNISGKLVKAITVKPQHKILNIDLSIFPSGLYIINVSANGQQIAAKKAVIE
ncbi:carboxypeptidase-like regulatory domain-containing protein [Hyunsoonleella sp. 2307UL5-6]|uniref:carboxypeptidase-like regulatory domain-containing protein n=1 Tax=Hyunsoonleella sp. 2307UL5-6 TaxID=3384768 RepID=UPI0039BC284E